MSHLSKIVRQVLLESAKGQDAEPEEPSFWREVGRTVDRYGNAAAGAVGTLAKATLDTFVGQAHAPGSEDDVLRAQASRVTIPTLLAGMGEYILSLRFRIGAKIMDVAGRRDLVVGRVGEEDAKALLAGSLLHDLLEAGAFVPVAGYFSAVLDAVVYAAEGDVDRAAECFVMAGIMGAAEGSSLRSSGTRDASMLEAMRKSYGSVPLELERTGGEFPLTAQEAAEVAAFVERQADVLEKSGVQGASEISSRAKTLLKGRRPKFNRVLPNEARFLEANKAGRLLINGGVEGRTLSVLRDAAEYVDELKRLGKLRTDSPLLMNRQLSYTGETSPGTLPEREYTREFISGQYSKNVPHPRPSELPARPPPENPLIHGAGSRDLMDAWQKVARKYPKFWQGVKTVHWTGFGSKDFGGAVKSAIRFLDDASPYADLSTVGYTGDMVAGGSGGHDIFPIGIQVEGEITLATSGDAGTTNPRNREPGTKFKKMPQVGFERLSVGGEDVTLPRIARGTFSQHASFGADSKLMVGPTSWREPYVGGAGNHNELIVGGDAGWRPKAIVIDPSDVKLRQGASNWPEEIGRLFDAARKHDIPVIDPAGRAVSPSQIASGARDAVLKDMQRLDAEIVRYEDKIRRIKPGESGIDDGIGWETRRSLEDYASHSREMLARKQEVLKRISDMYSDMK